MQNAPAYFGSIPSGVAGVRATLKVMVSVVRAVLAPNNPKAWSALRSLGFSIVFDPGVATQNLLMLRTTAQHTIQMCGEKDYLCEARALQSYVRDTIRYTRDMRTAETIQFPDKTLTYQSGDCDDKSILLAALAETVGFHTRFCAIGVQGQDFSHVSAQLLIPGKGWVNAETIPIDNVGSKAPLGWFPQDATCLMLAHI